MIGTRIRIARKAKKLTLREIGDAMSVSPQAVAQWEKSNPLFDRDKSSALASLLDASLMWLEGEIGDNENIIRDPAFEKTTGKAPVCTLEEAIQYRFVRGDILGANLHKKFKDHYCIEPSERIIGQATAIIIPKDYPDLGLRKDDIAIFDDGVRTKIGDVIWCFVFLKNSIEALFGKYVADVDDPANSAGVIQLAAEHEGAYDGDEDLQSEAETGIAGVLVELRRFRRSGPLWDARAGKAG